MTDMHTFSACLAGYGDESSLGHAIFSAHRKNPKEARPRSFLGFELLCNF